MPAVSCWENIMSARRSMDGLHGGFYFCSNPSCLCGLHVRMGDPGVRGEGNWAELACGVIIGRLIVQGAFLCDGCARALLMVIVTLEIVPPPPKPKAAEPAEQQSLAL